MYEEERDVAETGDLGAPEPEIAPLEEVEPVDLRLWFFVGLLCGVMLGFIVLLFLR